jgi:hypothetical protein
VTPDVENIISVEKGLYVAESCQVQNIPTDNCGSKLISLFLLILKIFDVIYYFFWKKSFNFSTYNSNIVKYKCDFLGYVIPISPSKA